MLNEIVTTVMSATSAVQAAESVHGLAKVGQFISEHRVPIIVGATSAAVTAGTTVAVCNIVANKNDGVLKGSIKNNIELAKKKREEKKAAEEEAKKAEEKECSNCQEKNSTSDNPKADEKSA